jgi:hypothetical protein
MSLHATGLFRGTPPGEAVVESATSVSSAYAAASITLFSRLWLVLEELAACEESDPERFETALQILRLELVVLLDACESSRWRSLLPTEHRLELETTLKTVLRILSERLDDCRDACACAQDYLIDAVLAQCPNRAGLVRSASSN